MGSSNIDKFELQVLRAMAALYAEHPKSLNLGCAQILVPYPNMNDPDYNVRMEEAAGTVRWLHRNGIVAGDLDDGGDIAVIGVAQLSLVAYAKLRAEEGSAGKSLGQIAIETLKKGKKDDMAAISAHIVERMCER